MLISIDLFFWEVFLILFYEEKQVHGSLLSIIHSTNFKRNFELQTYIVYSPFAWGIFGEVWDHYEYMPKLILMKRFFGLKN